MCVTIRANPKVTPDQLVKLLKDQACHFQYLMVSDWRDVRFISFDQRDTSSLEASYSGRAFGPNVELRWRRNEDETHFICRWISDNCPAPSGEGWKSLPEDEMKTADDEKETLTPKDVNYLLWGEPLWEIPSDDESSERKWKRDKDTGNRIWYQARIPRALTYPVPDNLVAEWENSRTDRTPLVLRVCEYQQNGQTMFERFMSLDRYGAKEPQKKDEQRQKDKEE